MEITHCFPLSFKTRDPIASNETLNPRTRMNTSRTPLGVSTRLSVCLCASHNRIRPPQPQHAPEYNRDGLLHRVWRRGVRPDATPTPGPLSPPSAREGWDGCSQHMCWLSGVAYVWDHTCGVVRLGETANLDRPPASLTADHSSVLSPSLPGL